MTRRWIICSFCLALLLIGIGVWAASATGEALLEYDCAGHRVVCRNFDSSIFCGYAPPRNGYPATTGWQYHFTPKDRGDFWPPLAAYNYSFLGFGYYWHRAVGIYLPHWFITILLFLATLYAWRKTQPKTQGGAFPVETKQTIREETS